MSVLWCTTYDGGGATPKLTRLNPETMVCIDGVSAPPPVGRNIEAPMIGATNINSAKLSTDANEMAYGSNGSIYRTFNHKTLVQSSLPALPGGVTIVGMAMDDTYYYIINGATQTVQRYSRTTGALVSTIYNNGAGALQVALAIQIHYYNGYLYVIDQNNKKILIGETANFANTVVYSLGVGFGTTWFIRGGIFDRNNLYCSITVSAPSTSEHLAKYVFNLPNTVGALVSSVATTVGVANASFYGLAVNQNYLAAFNANNNTPNPYGPSKSFALFDKNLNFLRSSVTYINTIACVGGCAFDDWYACLTGTVSYAASFAGGKAARRRTRQFNPATDIL